MTPHLRIFSPFNHNCIFYGFPMLLILILDTLTLLLSLLLWSPSEAPFSIRSHCTFSFIRLQLDFLPSEDTNVIISGDDPLLLCCFIYSVSKDITSLLESAVQIGLCDGVTLLGLVTHHDTSFHFVTRCSQIFNPVSSETAPLQRKPSI